MKSITIHGLEDQLNKKINDQAKRKGLSLNKTIKYLLEESLGLNSAKVKDHRTDFTEFLGIWSEEDGKEFDSAVSDFEKINQKDWQ